MTTLANALIAYKNKQYNLLRVAYSKNVASLKALINSNILKYQRSSIAPALKQQFIKKLTIIFYANLVKLNQMLNKNIKYISSLRIIPTVAPVFTQELTPIPLPIIPAPVQPPAPVPPTAPRSNKKALLIGVNYTGTTNQLKGCINDVTDVGNFLGGKGFTTNVMTDLTSTKPTKSNILAEFKNLLQNSIPGDVLYFMFSGHGNTQKDTNNDEASGVDQLILPVDLQPIVDDDLKSMINQYLKTGVTLIALFDSCYSGTVLDLKYQYLDSLNYDTATIYDKESQTNGKVFMISGCTDKQTSEDAVINNKYNGALTWSYLETLQTSATILTWRVLVKTMRSKLVDKRFSQIPQFSCGQPTNIDENVFW